MIKRFIKSKLDQYQAYILTATQPTEKWQKRRILLHKISLPFKVAYYYLSGLKNMYVINVLDKQRFVPDAKTFEQRKKTFIKHLKSLPVWNSSGNKLYAPLVPGGQPANGSNHLTEKQTLQQGILQFCLSKLAMKDDRFITGTANLIHGSVPANGVKVNLENEVFFNRQSLGADTLTGLSLAICSDKLGTEIEVVDDTEYVLLLDSESLLRERFELMMYDLMDENDLSFIEKARPDGSVAAELFKNEVRIKSEKGMFNPGLELNNSNALAILAALRVTQIKIRSRQAGVFFDELIKLGYGKLGRFASMPTVTNMVNLYILASLSQSEKEKQFWLRGINFQWKITRKWRNGFYTGLLKLLGSKAVTKKDVNDCLAYLYEAEPRTKAPTIVCTHKVTHKHPQNCRVPVAFNELNETTLSFDVDRRVQVYLSVTDEVNVRIGLGWLAEVVLLEEDPKQLLKDNKNETQ